MMHGPLSGRDDDATTATGNAPVAVFARALSVINSIILVFAALALIANMIAAINQPAINPPAQREKTNRGMTHHALAPAQHSGNRKFLLTASFKIV